MRLAKSFQLKEKTLEFSQLVKKAHKHRVQGLKKQNIKKMVHIYYILEYILISTAFVDLICN